jgi:hypothetical protein
MNYLSSTAFRAVCRILVVTTLALGIQVPYASAAVMGTDTVVVGQSDQARDQLKRLLDRADVRGELAKRGVSADLAKQRVDALSDQEVQRVAGKIDSLPAGGSDILGVLVLIFVILLITDILGLTKVFPFTKPVR